MSNTEPTPLPMPETASQAPIQPVETPLLGLEEAQHAATVAEIISTALASDQEPELVMKSLVAGGNGDAVPTTEKPLFTWPTEAERKKMFEPSDAMRASTFTRLMRHDNAPMSFRIQVLDRLKQWQLIDSSVDTSAVTNLQAFYDITNSAIARADQERPEFAAAFRQNPWNFDQSVEGEYTDEELQEMFPRGVELKSVLGEETRFIFRSEPGQFYLRLVEQPDGRRRVIRVLDTERNIEEINADAQKAPSVVPRFEAVHFQDGKTGLLIDWIDGEMPTTPEEKTLCIEHAPELLDVPIDGYDLWPGNFLVAKEREENGQPKVFYIDQDIPKAIASQGLSPETAQERQGLLQEGLKKFT